MEKKKNDNILSVLGKYDKLVIYAIIVILINLVSVNLFLRLDLTRNHVYSLSKASKKVVSTLSEPMTIKVFFTKNLPAPYNGVERYLHDLLKEYSMQGNRYFNYEFYDVSGKEGQVGFEAQNNQKMAEDYGLYPVRVQQLEQDEVKFQNAYMGMVFIHGNIVDKIVSVSSTEGLEYRITTMMQKMNNKISALINITNQIEVKLVMSSSLKVLGPYMNLPGLADLPQKIGNLVSSLNDKNYGKLKFTYLDPTINPELEKTAVGYNLLSLKWPALSDRSHPGNKIEAGKGYIGLVIEYGGKSETLQLINMMQIPIIGTQYQLEEINAVENSINASIENLINVNQEIGYLADHGTLTAQEMGKFHGILSQNYNIKDVNLKKENIPEGIQTLIIAGPKEKFTDYDLFQIDQFLMKGKSLAIFYHTFNEIQIHQEGGFGGGQEPISVPNDTGLDTLLNHYGLGYKKAYVLDESCYIQQNAEQGDFPIYYAPIIKTKNISQKLDFINQIKQLIMLKIAPLELLTNSIDSSSVKSIQLFSSSDKSWLMEGRITLNPMMIAPAQDKDKKAYPLAYILDGKFNSFFTGKNVPAREETGVTNKNKQKPQTGSNGITNEVGIIGNGKPGKIFLIATSEVLKDNMLDDQGISPNAMFIMNVIDYLNGKTDNAVMRSKSQGFNPLKEVRPEIKTFTKTFNIAGLPVLVILAGILVWMRRISRKKHIEAMFVKK